MLGFRDFGNIRRTEMRISSWPLSQRGMGSLSIPLSAIKTWRQKDRFVPPTRHTTTVCGAFEPNPEMKVHTCDAANGPVQDGEVQRGLRCCGEMWNDGVEESLRGGTAVFENGSIRSTCTTVKGTESQAASLVLKGVRAARSKQKIGKKRVFGQLGGSGVRTYCRVPSR